MTFSLTNHHRGYQIRATDLLLSLATGFSGTPYALRHYDVSKGRLGQKVLCMIEFVPVLGGLVALIELVVATLFNWIAYLFFGGIHLDIPWRSTPLTVEKAMEKMHHNANRAIQEHANLSSAYFSARAALPPFDKLGKTESTLLKLTPHFADHIGPRPQMEDAHCFKEIEQGAIAGVFDGHGGSAVAQYACRQFENRFESVLNQCEGNVHHAFETLIHQIHQEVVQTSFWNSVGSTATICFFDLKRHLVYTANLADSEANIVRDGGSIPLSVTHNFTKRGDARRLERAHGVAAGYVQECLKEGEPPKNIRSRLHAGGVNVSRAFGDLDETGTLEHPIVIHKPTITVQKLRKGDWVSIVCDGVKDFVPEDKCCKIICNTKQGENPAHNLVHYAVKDAKSQDNVTALIINVA